MRPLPGRTPAAFRLIGLHADFMSPEGTDLIAEAERRSSKRASRSRPTAAVPTSRAASSPTFGNPDTSGLRPTNKSRVRIQSADKSAHSIFGAGGLPQHSAERLRLSARHIKNFRGYASNRRHSRK